MLMEDCATRKASMTTSEYVQVRSICLTKSLLASFPTVASNRGQGQMKSGQINTVIAEDVLPASSNFWLRDFLSQSSTSLCPIALSGWSSHEVSWWLSELKHWAPTTWCFMAYPGAALLSSLPGLQTAKVSKIYLVLWAEHKAVAAIHPTKGFNTKRCGLELLHFRPNTAPTHAFQRELRLQGGNCNHLVWHISCYDGFGGSFAVTRVAGNHVSGLCLQKQVFYSQISARSHCLTFSQPNTTSILN